MIGILLAASATVSTPDLGVAEGRCRPGRTEPSVMITVDGLKDRKGQLIAELYPPNDGDFLADDNLLIAAGKTFRRAVLPVPAAGPVTLCLRVPTPGVYALSVLHDRDRNRKFGFTTDGVGFSNNPVLGRSKPPASAVRFTVGDDPKPVTVVLNYLHGFLQFGPIRRGS